MNTSYFKCSICGIVFSAWILFLSAAVIAQDAVPAPVPDTAPAPAPAPAAASAPAPVPVPVVDDKAPTITPIPGGYHVEWSVLTDIGGIHISGSLVGKVELMFDIRKDDIDKKLEPPNTAEVFLPLADYWIVRGKPEKAIPLYRQGLEKDPDNLLFQNNLAMLLSTIDGKHNEGLQIIDSALEKRRDNVTLLDTKGMILLNDGRSDEAIPVLERAVELSCQHPIYCMHLAKALDMAGREASSRNWFDKSRPLLEAAPGKLTKENKDMFDYLRLKYPQSTSVE